MEYNDPTVKRKKTRRGGKNKKKTIGDLAGETHDGATEFKPNGRSSSNSKSNNGSMEDISTVDVVSGTNHDNDNKPIAFMTETIGENNDNNNWGGDSSILDVASVEQDTREYFQNVENMLDNPEFESQEDLDMFIENVYAELDGKETMVAADYETSRILEKLLKSSSDFNLRVFADRLNGIFYDLARHQFASHVCQTLLSLAPMVIERELKNDKSTSEQKQDNGDDENVDATLPSMESSLLSLCEQLDGHWMELFTHTFASHVIRTLLNVLSGQRLVKNHQDLRSRRSTEYNKHYNNESISMKVTRIPQSFRERLDKIIHDLFDGMTPRDLQSLAIHPVANPVLQLLVASPDVGSQISSMLLYSNPTNPTNPSDTPSSFFPMLINHKIGSHLVEKVILHSSDDVRASVYKVFLKDRLTSLIFDPIANFIIQKFVSSLADVALFQDVLATVLPIFDKILFENRAGLAVEVMKTAIRFPTTQESVYTALQKAFGVLDSTTDASSSFALMLLYMKTASRYKPDLMTYTPVLHGALLLQHALHFQIHGTKTSSSASSSLISSLLSVLGTSQEWLSWAQDPICSRVLEALFESPTVPLKEKKTFIKVLQGSFCDISCHKYGSHLVDKIWTCSSLEMRESIAQELFSQKNRMLNDFHGKFVYRNCKIDLFRRRKDEWTRYQQGLVQRQQEKNSHAVEEKEANEDEGSNFHQTNKKRKGDERLDVGDGVLDKKPAKKMKKKKKMDEIDELFEKVLH